MSPTAGRRAFCPALRSFRPASPRAQSSFEYLIILAIVLTLALAVLGSFGLFPSFSYGAQGGDSQRYWATIASPLQVPDLNQNGSSLILILLNQAPVSITIPAGGFNLSTRPDNLYAPSSGLPLTLPPGGRASLPFTTESCAGRQTLLYSVNISYNAEQITGLTQRGAKPLYVQCMD
jgi:hypothetical protein